MNVPLFIARRYLLSGKSHNVINVISAVSAAGMAIGTAALILILSIYNGFDSLIEANISDLDPDVRISALQGKFFTPDSSLVQALRSREEVAGLCRTLEDNVFITYAEGRSVARIKGVEQSWSGMTGLGGHITEGKLELQRGETPLCLVGSALARSVKLHPRFSDKLTIYYPRRDVPFSAVDPEASLSSTEIRPGAIFSISAQTDRELIIAPLPVVSRLLGCGGELSSIEIKLKKGTDPDRFISSLDLGENLKALDRRRQNDSLYKMMRYEKLSIYMILIFVVIIVAINIFNSLSMLVIEKREDMRTLRSLGADEGLERKVFVYEGCLISLSGMVAGLGIGVALALLQQHLGIVKMPGNYLISAYPAILKATDVLWTVLGVGAIGLGASLLGERCAHSSS